MLLKVVRRSLHEFIISDHSLEKAWLHLFKIFERFDPDQLNFVSPRDFCFAISILIDNNNDDNVFLTKNEWSEVIDFFSIQINKNSNDDEYDHSNSNNNNNNNNVKNVNKKVDYVLFCETVLNPKEITEKNFKNLKNNSSSKYKNNALYNTNTNKFNFKNNNNYNSNNNYNNNKEEKKKIFLNRAVTKPFLTSGITKKNSNNIFDNNDYNLNKSYQPNNNIDNKNRSNYNSKYENNNNNNTDRFIGVISGKSLVSKNLNNHNNYQNKNNFKNKNNTVSDEKTRSNYSTRSGVNVNKKNNNSNTDDVDSDEILKKFIAISNQQNKNKSY
jgi:hypothetical protein